MPTIIAINDINADHLAGVMAEMEVRGSPVLRCIADDVQGMIVALEGSHRLVAAQRLGLAPILQMLDDDEMLSCSDIGYDDCGTFEGQPARAADIRDHLGTPMGTYGNCVFLDFPEVAKA